MPNIITHQMNSAIDKLLLSAAKRIRPDRFDVQGIIKIHELGDMTPAEYAYWWLPEKDIDGRVLRLPRLSRREKERFFQVAEFHNLLTNAGKQALLTYVSSQSNNSLPFGQTFAVGNGALVQVLPTDTAIAGTLLFSSPFLTSTVVGTQVDLYATFGGTSGNGTWTNVGILGGGNANSPVLYTHALANYTKVTGLIAADYILSIY